MPEFPTTLSQQIHNIIGRRIQERGGRLSRLLVARQNMDAAEIEFADMLVEDHNNAALAYTDCTYTFRDPAARFDIVPSRSVARAQADHYCGERP